VTRERIGIFGGTFDPIHIGHLAVAERACDELGIARILFVPAMKPPHKPHRVISPIADRLRMLELAISGNERFGWSDVDLRPDKPSYTVEMLEELARRHPDNDFDFIVGADSLRDFHTWHQPERILELARLIVADRPGVVVNNATYEGISGYGDRIVRFAAPLLEVSSTDLRQRRALGKSIRYLVPEPVFAYIHERGLYTQDAAAARIEETESHSV